MYYVVVDVESTGLEKLAGPLSRPTSVTKMGSEVIQVGGLFLDEQMNPVKGFCHYCDCLTAHSDSAAFSVHGIPLEEVRAVLAGTFLEEVVTLWLPQFFEDDITFIGYNVMFDFNMLAQGLRDFPIKFKSAKRVVSKVSEHGRYCLDVMDFLGAHRAKLSSYAKQFGSQREEFFTRYSRHLPVESNCPDMYRDSWLREHNALYDSINTYLLYRQRVWGYKVFRGGRRGN